MADESPPPPGWSIGVMPARVWARGTVGGTGPVIFGSPFDPDYIRDGYSHAFYGWPPYAYAQYTIQQGAKWETGLGEFVMIAGGGITGSLLRLAVRDSSAGVGTAESFDADFCDIALVPTASSTQMRLLASYGDGSDGDVTVSGNVTLTRTMFYNDLTITSLGRIQTAGHAVFVAGTLTMPDSTAWDSVVFAAPTANDDSSMWVARGPATAPANGGLYFESGGSSPAFGGQTPFPALPLCLGGYGGAGSAGASSGNGGFEICDPGASGGSAPSIPSFAEGEFLYQPLGEMYTAVGGASGGGGGADSTTSFGGSFGGEGGAGGAPGITIQVYARAIKGGASAHGTYHFAISDGGNGGNGTPGSGDGMNGTGGNGGGGGGGALILMADYIDRAPWTFRANGGSAPGGGGATGGTGGAVYGYVHGTARPVIYRARDEASAPVTTAGNSFTARLNFLGADRGNAYIAFDGVSQHAVNTDEVAPALFPGGPGPSVSFTIGWWIRGPAPTVTTSRIYSVLCTGESFADLLTQDGNGTNLQGLRRKYSGGTATSNRAWFSSSWPGPTLFDTVEWTLVARVLKPGAQNIFVGDAMRPNATDDTFSAATYVHPVGSHIAFPALLNSSGTLNAAGQYDIRAPFVALTAMSEAELQALAALGPTADLSALPGWWPGDGDTYPTWRNRGTAGAAWDFTLKNGSQAMIKVV